MTTTKEFLAGRSGKRTYEEVPLGGQTITIRSLTYEERLAINLRYRENGADTREDAPVLRQALFLQQSIVDAAKNLVFTEGDADLAILSGLPGPDVDALDEVIRRLNFKPAEDLGKNSTPAKTNAS